MISEQQAATHIQTCCSGDLVLDLQYPAATPAHVACRDRIENDYCFSRIKISARTHHSRIFLLKECLSVTECFGAHRYIESTVQILRYSNVIEATIGRIGRTIW